MNLPGVHDFTVTDDPKEDLDGYRAWEHFGGLDLDAAYDRFCGNPLCYQEDFMFMGTGAFLFYYPVIDRYIREIEGPEHGFDDETWILACGIRKQFTGQPRGLVPIRDRVVQLCDFVLHGLSELPDGSTFRPVQEIVDAWSEAREDVTRLTDAPTPSTRTQ